jgi:hypothetical protein
VNSIEHYAHNLAVLQIAITVTVIAIYAVYAAFKEQDDYYSSIRRMLTLTAFIFENHPKMRDLSSVLVGFNLKNNSRAASRDIAIFFEIARIRYVESGKFPEKKESPSANILEFILYLIFAPLVSFIFNVMLFFETKGRRHLLIHTEYRKNFFCRLTVLMAIQLLLAYVEFVFFLPTNPIYAMTLIPTCIGGALLCATGMLQIAKQQWSWKAYWTDRLYEVVASAGNAKHDYVASGANDRIEEIRKEPAVPIPMSIGVVSGVYGVATVVATGVASLLHWT